jgi:hypothetical protein
LITVSVATVAAFLGMIVFLSISSTAVLLSQHSQPSERMTGLELYSPACYQNMG